MAKTTQFGELKASEPFYYPAEGWYGMKLYTLKMICKWGGHQVFMFLIKGKV